MQRKDAKTIILYYRAIPDMRRLLMKERQQLEDEFAPLGGVNMDGMPHGSSVGNPVENLAIRREESGTADRLREIGRRLAVLEEDRRQIQGALDALYGKYKTVLTMRYIVGYSWGGISARMGVPDSTVRHWEEKAMGRLGKALEDADDPGAILGRASRARV